MDAAVTSFGYLSASTLTKRTREPSLIGPSQVSIGLISIGSSPRAGVTSSSLTDSISFTCTFMPAASKLHEICFDSRCDCPLAIGTGPRIIFSLTCSFNVSSFSHPLRLQVHPAPGGCRAAISFGCNSFQKSSQSSRFCLGLSIVMDTSYRLLSSEKSTAGAGPNSVSIAARTCCALPEKPSIVDSIKTRLRNTSHFTASKPAMRSTSIAPVVRMINARRSPRSIVRHTLLEASAAVFKTDTRAARQESLGELKRKRFTAAANFSTSPAASSGVDTASNSPTKPLQMLQSHCTRTAA
mmetsp:Transcript_8002/g.14491  ORF Transcript_8002/g.14491 Transcript_8002/m.14491 type:complete len:297 (+) Transcript_8002:270-1160(+)